MFDRVAISGSALCMIHCLLAPILLIAVPVLATSFLVDEQFHPVLLAFVLPVSLVALFLGCRRHKDGAVVLLGGLGLVSLVVVALLGHDLLGEFGERIATVVSGVVLAAGHLRNYRLCRHEGC